MSNFNRRTITLEIFANNLTHFRSRYVLSRNLAICCDIFNRSACPNGYQEVFFENRGVKCKQFQNFDGVVLVVNEKYACQEAEDFDLLHNNEWIDTSCTMYSTKLFNQLKSIDELAYLRDINLIDNSRYVQLEVDGRVVVVDQEAFGRNRDQFGNILKTKYGTDFQDGNINKYLKVVKNK